MKQIKVIKRGATVPAPTTAATAPSSPPTLDVVALERDFRASVLVTREQIATRKAAELAAWRGV